MMHDSTSEIPKTIDNVSCRLGDDIASHLVAEASVDVASTGFSLSAFEHLADELERVKAVRFVFTAPAFLPQTAVKEHIRKERREFFIPGVGEASLLGTEYEIRLRNRLMQKAVAKRCGGTIHQEGRDAISEQKTEGDVESLFNSTETTALQGDCSHIDAFELLAFFVVKEREMPPTEAQRHGGDGRES